MATDKKQGAPTYLGFREIVNPQIMSGASSPTTKQDMDALIRQINDSLRRVTTANQLLQQEITELKKEISEMK